MAYVFRDPSGEECPTCPECGSIMVRIEPDWRCGNCWYFIRDRRREIGEIIAAIGLVALVVALLVLGIVREWLIWTR
jgi:hypothetical protein